MALIEQIDGEIKQAMRAKDAERLSVLRLIKNDLKKAELDAPLTPEKEQEVLKRMAKQRRDSIEQFKLGNRPELAAKEETELRAIESFLPASLTEDQVDAIIDATLKEMGAVDPAKSGAAIGKVMAALKATGQSFDGKAANERVRKRLAS